MAAECRKLVEVNFTLSKDTAVFLLLRYGDEYLFSFYYSGTWADALAIIQIG